MMTKQRKEFEAWWESPEQFELRKSCARGWGMFVWQAAQKAAIASIEIELPDESEEKYWVEHKDGMSSVFQLRHYDLDLRAALHKAGLRVKS